MPLKQDVVDMIPFVEGEDESPTSAERLREMLRMHVASVSDDKKVNKELSESLKHTEEQIEDLRKRANELEDILNSFLTY